MATPTILCGGNSGSTPPVVTYSLITSEQLGRKYPGQGLAAGFTGVEFRSFDVGPGTGVNSKEFDDLYNKCRGVGSSSSGITSNMSPLNISMSFNSAYVSHQNYQSVSQQNSWIRPRLDSTNTRFNLIKSGYDVQFPNATAGEGGHDGDLYIAMTVAAPYLISNLNQNIGSNNTQRAYVYFTDTASGGNIGVMASENQNSGYAAESAIPKIHIAGDMIYMAGFSDDSHVDLQIYSVRDGNVTYGGTKTITKSSQWQGISDQLIYGTCVAIYHKNSVNSSVQGGSIRETVQAVVLYKIATYHLVAASIDQECSLQFNRLSIWNRTSDTSEPKIVPQANMSIEYKLYSTTDGQVYKYARDTYSSTPNYLRIMTKSMIDITGNMGTIKDVVEPADPTAPGSLERVYRELNTNTGALYDYLLTMGYVPGRTLAGDPAYMTNFKFGRIKTSHSFEMSIDSVNSSNTKYPIYYLGKSGTNSVSGNGSNDTEADFYFFGTLPNSKQGGPGPGNIDVAFNIPTEDSSTGAVKGLFNYGVSFPERSNSPIGTITYDSALGRPTKVETDYSIPSVITSQARFRFPVLINDTSRNVEASTSMLGKIVYNCPGIELERSCDIETNPATGADATQANQNAGNATYNMRWSIPATPGNAGNNVIGWNVNHLGKLSNESAQFDTIFGYPEDPKSPGMKHKDVQVKGYTVKYGPIEFNPISAESQQERNKYTYRYTFNFHFMYFDFQNNRNPRGSDGQRYYRALTLDEFPGLDTTSNYFYENNTSTSDYLERTGLVMTSRSLLDTRPVRDLTKYPDPGPYSVFFGAMSIDDDRRTLQMERNNIWASAARLDNTNMAAYGNPLDRLNPSLSCKLNGYSGVAYKNSVWPFELEFAKSYSSTGSNGPDNYFGNDVLNGPAVGFDDLVTKESTGKLTKLSEDAKMWRAVVSN